MHQWDCRYLTLATNSRLRYTFGTMVGYGKHKALSHFIILSTSLVSSSHTDARYAERRWNVVSSRWLEWPNINSDLLHFPSENDSKNWQKVTRTGNVNFDVSIYQSFDKWNKWPQQPVSYLWGVFVTSYFTKAVGLHTCPCPAFPVMARANCGQVRVVGENGGGEVRWPPRGRQKRSLMGRCCPYVGLGWHPGPLLD